MVSGGSESPDTLDLLIQKGRPQSPAKSTICRADTLAAYCCQLMSMTNMASFGLGCHLRFLLAP
jgi:hypothetical protein